jgi:hypothetical protein
VRQMHIIRLKPGERAPTSADRVYINSLRDPKNGWSGAIAVGREGLFGIGVNEYRTAQEAEAEAIAWAERHGVVELQIEIGRA